MKTLIYYWHKFNYIEYELLVAECLNEEVKVKLKRKLDFHYKNYQGIKHSI
ncbi:hypothetical protein ACOI1C_14500 [Bacillus sp. DJP31]|uniref:hypothetical protein n=1 Tax=Bacillus sp. DJP31 TaxID=3409789 RepID=UPI003BB4A19B